MASVRPTQRHMHERVEGPEALSAFRRPPDDSKPHAREKTLNQIRGLAVWAYCIERQEAEARFAKSSL